MKNQKIGRILRYYRTLRNYTVQTVSDKLNEAKLPAAAKTIYGWESGRTQPDADRLLFLCRLYEIDDILSAFGYRQPPDSFPISEREQELLTAYRNHPELHPAIHKLLDLDESPFSENP